VVLVEAMDKTRDELSKRGSHERICFSEANPDNR